MRVIFRKGREGDRARCVANTQWVEWLDFNSTRYPWALTRAGLQPPCAPREAFQPPLAFTRSFRALLAALAPKQAGYD
jgi:hypothetical protein